MAEYTKILAYKLDIVKNNIHTTNLHSMQSCENANALPGTEYWNLYGPEKDPE